MANPWLGFGDRLVGSFETGYGIGRSRRKDAADEEQRALENDRIAKKASYEEAGMGGSPAAYGARMAWDLKRKEVSDNIKNAEAKAQAEAHRKQGNYWQAQADALPNKSNGMTGIPQMASLLNAESLDIDQAIKNAPTTGFFGHGDKVLPQGLQDRMKQHDEDRAAMSQILRAAADRISKRKQVPPPGAGVLPPLPGKSWRTLITKPAR